MYKGGEKVILVDGCVGDIRLFGGKDPGFWIKDPDHVCEIPAPQASIHNNRYNYYSLLSPRKSQFGRIHSVGYCGVGEGTIERYRASKLPFSWEKKKNAPLSHTAELQLFSRLVVRSQFKICILRTWNLT